MVLILHTLGNPFGPSPSPELGRPSTLYLVDLPTFGQALFRVKWLGHAQQGNKKHQDPVAELTYRAGP